MFFGLFQYRNIEGIVMDQDGKPLKNAVVSPKGLDQSATTDEKATTY
jgi:hypothetical protein